MLRMPLHPFGELQFPAVNRCTDHCLPRWLDAPVVARREWYARPPLPWAECLPIVFLRHPLLRALSVCQFTQKDPSQPYAQVARKHGFADYVRWALRQELGSIVIRNYQVVHLSEASWQRPSILDATATRSDLTQACNLLSGWGALLQQAADLLGANLPATPAVDALSAQ